MTTDFRDYFSNKISQEIERTTPVEYRPTKYDEVQAAAQDKITLLDRRISEAKQRELAEASSWVGQLGLDPDGFTAQGVNLGASLYSGASRVAGDMTAFAAADLEAMAMDGTLSEPEKQAVGRYFKGEANEFDVDLITTNKGPNKLNALQLAERAREARARGENIRGAFDRTDTVHQGRRDELSADLGESFGSAWGQTKEGAKALFAGKDAGVGGQLGGAGDMLAGAAKLLFNAGEAAVTNPGAALEYVAENAPQLAMGMAGGAGKAALIISNLGYASGEYQKGIQKYQAENGGAYPPEAQRMEMAAYAASLALAEQVGDMSLLKGAQGAVDAAKNTAKTGFLQSIKNATLAGAKGYGTEAATEGYQTFAEGQANLTPVSAEQMYEGAAIGGMVGGGLAGGGRAVGEVLKATPEHAAEREVVRVTEQARTEAIQAAIVSGDVSPLTDTNNAAYSPPDAIAALAAHAAAAPDEETKQADQAKAVEIVGNLEDGLATAQANIKNTTPEGLAELKSQLETQEAKGNTAVVEALKSTIAQAEGATKADKRSMEVLVRKMEERVTQARANMTQFTVEAAEAGEVDVDTLKAQALGTVPEPTITVAEDGTEVSTPGVAPTPEVRTQAAKKLILKAMASRVMDPVEAKSLAEDGALGLSEGERSYLRAFSEAQVAMNKTKGLDLVQRDVLVGSKGKLGLTQHAQRIGSALVAGEKRLATSYMSTLRAFQASHVGKAAAVAEAWEQGMGTQVERTAEGVWQVRDSALPRLSDKQIAINGGLTVNTEKLVIATAAESSAISYTLKELEAAYALKFNTATTGATTNVPVVPQAPASGQATPVGNQEVQDQGSLVAPEGNTGAAVPGPSATGIAESKPVPVVAKVKETQSESNDIPPWVADEVPLSEVEEDQSAEGTSSSMQSTEDSTLETASTELKTSQESPEGTSVAPEVTKTPDEGHLSLFEEADETNLVTTGFKQESSRPGDTTKRPLVAIKDFLGRLLDDANDFLETAVDQKQYEALEFFKAKTEAWTKTLRANLPKRKTGDRAKYRHEDVMQYLLTEGKDGKADLNLNVMTAISYAVMNWVAAEALTPPPQEDKKREAGNSILGLPKGAWAKGGREAYNALGRAGVYQHLLMDSLGTAAYDALGLKDSADTAQNLAPRLRMALGFHALKLMEDKGLVRRTTFGSDQFAAWAGRDVTDADIKRVKEKGDNKGQVLYHPQHFFAINRDSEGNPVQGVREIHQALKGTKGVLEKLFKVAGRARSPVLVPNGWVSPTTKGTTMLSPSELRKVLEKKQAEPHKLRKDLFALLKSMPAELVHSMIGMTPQEEYLDHVVNRDGRMAKNEGLQREYDLLVEFVEEYLQTSPDGLDTNFYYEFEAWKMQRVGIATTVANPQASKIARQLVFQPAWETVIDASDGDMINSFFLRVAEGLGMKTERADSMVSLIKIAETLAEPVFDDAIQALRKSVVRGETLTAEEQAAIVAGVVAGKENLHALNALTAVAYQQEAESKMEEGDETYTFTSQLMGEVDGVANGTMLNLILLGAANTAKELAEMLQPGGFYTEGSDYTEFNQYRGTPGNLDIYESTGREVDTEVSEACPPGTPDGILVNAIWNISGKIYTEETGVTKAGRDLVKEAMNPLAFGSTLKSVIEGMSVTFLDNVYKGFEKLSVQVREGKATQEEVDTYVDHINMLLEGSKVRSIPSGRPIAWHMEQAFHPAVEAQIKKAFAGTVGKATSNVLGTKFAVFLARRDSLNHTANVTYGLSNAVMQGEREAYIEELVKKGEILLDFEGKRIGDLTKKQEKALQKRLAKIQPLIQTAMSKASEGVDAGLRMAKHKRKQNPDPVYQNRVGFGTPLKNADAETSATVGGFSTLMEEPGVAMGSAQTHSFDSALSHRVQAQLNVLNVHDALGAGVGGLKGAAQAINKALWEGLLEYSPLEEQYQALARVVRGIASMKKKNQLSPNSIFYLQQFLNERALEEENAATELMSSWMKSAKAEAVAAETIKLQVQSQLIAVDQYAFQGGNFQPQDSDRDAAAKRLKDLERGIPKQDQNALNDLVVLMNLKPGDIVSTPVAEGDLDSDLDIDADAVNEDAAAEPEGDVAPWEEAAPVPAGSPFGDLGTPKRVNKTLAEFFKDKDEVPAQDVLNVLLQSIAKGNGYQRLLLGMLNKAVPKDLKVKVISKHTQKKDVANPPSGFFYGYHYDNTIYILNNDFVKSGLQTTEVLLHELVHGALAQIIQLALDGQGTKEAAQMVVALQDLMERAKKQATAKEIKDFGEAFEDVHEFVAYGMTRKSFQDVLARLQVPGRMGLKNMVDGFKAFVDKLVDLLFAGSPVSQQEQATSALTSLIENVTGLMAATAQPAGTARPSGRSSPLASRVMDVVQDYTTLDIHEALDGTGVSTRFDEHLRSLLGDLVHKLHGPFGAFKAGLMKQQAMSPMDVWLKALDTGVVPLALSVAASPMASTERERHAMEQIQATVKMALDTNDASTRVAHKELRDLYLEMRDVFKPSDFASQAEYDFVFAVELDANNRSDYLSRFAALTLGHEGFNKLMHRATPKTPKVKDLSFADKVQRIFERILAYFAEKMTHTYAGQPANQKLEQLVSQLVDIEAKRKLAIARKALAKDPLEGINKMAAAGAEKLRAGVSAVAKSSMVANNRIPVVKTYVQLAGKVTDLYANDRSQWLIGTLKDYSNKHFKNLSKLPMELMTQVGGMGKVLTLLQLATTLQQKHRKDMIALTTKAVLDSFVKGSKSLKKGKEAVRVKAAMTQVLMRSGAHVLMSKFNMMQFETLLDDPAKLKLAIQETKAELEQVPALKAMAVHYMHQAQALGYFRMTGDARIPKLMLNAHNIVRMYGTNMAGKITEAHAQQAEEIVSRLVALYAMSYTTVSERQAVLEVLQEENTREDKGNGIEFVLKTAKLMDDRANETIFAQQKALMIHGFMPEIYNPNTAVVTATDAESVDLIGQGYVLVHRVGMDPADPDKTPRSLYALRDGGQARYQSAIMANTGMRTKGSPEHSGFLSPNSEAGMENLELNREIAAGKPTGLASGPLPDLTKPGTTFMVPVVNPKGTIVNWRYMMKDSTKDTILERDNRIEVVLGVLAGSIFDKQTTTETNIKTLKTLKELYESDKTLKSSNYVLVGPDVEDPELAEIWSMLPDDTKEVARRISGRTGIHIAKDMLMPVFGYRKYSLAESFRKSPEMRNIVERMMVPLIESFLTLYGRYQARRGGKPFTEQQAKAYAKRAAVLVTRGERGWNEIVKEIKDIVVIKSITVTVDNILSNISQLVLAGVPLKDILFNSMVALRGATAYELDSDELEQLELKVANGMTQGYPTIHADIARLKDSLARNPIRELIDSGLMPTIVEDVEADDNPYSYKSALVRGTEKYVNKLNPHIVSGIKTIYGTHDTKLYKGLNRIARLSDFAARYAMYQYETTRKENKVAKDDAIFNASESFINYDTPLPRAIQYVDDMGIIPFLKYYLRIQRVLLKLARENPGRVLGTLLLNNLVSLGPIVLESSWMHRIGNNPFQWGAVAYPGKIDDLPYIAAGLALIK